LNLEGLKTVKRLRTKVAKTVIENTTMTSNMMSYLLAQKRSSYIPKNFK
jgi:hypothetical protein